MTTTLVAIALLSIGRMEMTLPVTNHKALLEGFAFVIGSWAVDSETFPEAYGSSAGKTTGLVVASWGPEESWIVTDFTAALAPGREYTVHIVVAANPSGTGLTAFAVNTMSRAGIVYDGELVQPGHLAFVGESRGKWQQVTYQRIDDDHVAFVAEDGASKAGPWQRHSRALWTRSR